ncbi:transcription antitermination protein [Haloglomus halophilum]|uniref:transcription antitermination protein n=1 Tax=Haloglomus halophilum TaxID=2962672 RepID=UPI0020CA0F67|nr:transcription antitermination protein [Haloglomus halophilum]
MNGEELVANVRAERETELGRLGSEKAVVAATGAQLETSPVLSAAARLLDGGADTLAAWTDEVEHEAARAAFTDAGGSLADHRDAILGIDDDASADGDVPYVVDELRTAERTPERVAAGLVALPLVADRLLLQVINFLVNEGVRSGADTVREARSDLQAMPEDAADLLDDVCDDDGDWVTAQQAATDAIGTAYDEYAERLEEMGLDPKPVC